MQLHIIACMPVEQEKEICYIGQSRAMALQSVKVSNLVHERLNN